MKAAVFTAALCICVCILGGTAPAEATEKVRSPTQALHALFAEAWGRDLRDDPLEASYYGEHRFDGLLPDLSPAAIAEREAAERETLERVRSIDRASLSAPDRLNADLFTRIYRERVAAQPFKPYLYQLLSRDGLHTLSETTELLPFASVHDYDQWLARLRAVGRYLDESTALLRIAMRERRMQPHAVLDRIVAPLAALAQGRVEANPFYEPFTRIPRSLPSSQRQRIQEEGRSAVEQSVIPAYRRLNAFFVQEFLPAARANVGVWDTPDGAAFYRQRVSYYTTTNLSPAQIHRIGLEEVRRIRSEMERIIAEVGFKGSFNEFLEFLRTDRRFYYKTPQELLDGYRVIAKRIDPELVKLFGRLPRIPYGVRAVPATSAPNTTTAYYQGPTTDGTRPGYYYVNLYRPQVRPKYEMEVLTAHEAVPGHHLQIALAAELDDLPAFRRNAQFTAFVEGWALYAEGLGQDVGLYTDPYSRFGKLTYEMWRAVRLVVDTGMHDKRWTRQQAIDYFKANAAKTEADIVNEIDRYIAWPGQALAYKIGEMKILELRREAQGRLGARFDVREFHDTVLGGGPLPLDVLEGVVRRWISAAHPSSARSSAGEN